MMIFSFLACHTAPDPKYFNEAALLPASKPDEIVKSLSIKNGMVIADIGSGGGYFAYRFAEQTGSQGIVYAVDINKSYLTYIEEQIQERGIQNIKIVLAENDTSNLPEKCCDLIFLRDVYHHLPSPSDYFKKLKKNLKENGLIAIIDYKPADFFSSDFFTFVNIFGHTTKPETIESDMNLAGYQKVHEFHFLQKQSFQMFKAKSALGED